MNPVKPTDPLQETANLSEVTDLHQFTTCSLQTFKRTANLTKINDYLVLRRSVEKIGNWQGLCTNLELSETEYNRIMNEGYMEQQKKEECLRSYIKSDEDSWEEVVIAVARPPINNRRLARTIANDHLRSPNKDRILDMLKSCPKFYP